MSIAQFLNLCLFFFFVSLSDIPPTRPTSLPKRFWPQSEPTWKTSRSSLWWVYLKNKFYIPTKSACGIYYVEIWYTVHYSAQLQSSTAHLQSRALNSYKLSSSVIWKYQISTQSGERVMVKVQNSHAPWYWRSHMGLQQSFFCFVFCPS